MTVYLSPADVAKLIPGANMQYLAQLRYTGKGPRYLKPSPKIVLYLESDIDAWLEASARTGTAA